MSLAFVAKPTTYVWRNDYSDFGWGNSEAIAEFLPGAVDVLTCCPYD
jgi:hypothetical protein